MGLRRSLHDGRKRTRRWVTRFPSTHPLVGAAYYYGELAPSPDESDCYAARLLRTSLWGALTPGAPNVPGGSPTPTPTPTQRQHQRQTDANTNANTNAKPDRDADSNAHANTHADATPTPARRRCSLMLESYR